MPIFYSNFKFNNKFLRHLDGSFSTRDQIVLFREFIYAMFKDYKRLSLDAIANNAHTNYQKLQYFFSETNWNIEKLNDARTRLRAPFYLSTKITLLDVLSLHCCEKIAKNIFSKKGEILQKK